MSFTASDGCSQVGTAYDTFIASFAPDELDTVTWLGGPTAPGFTAVNSFAYGPCGPPGANLNGKPYQPPFAAPHALFDQMGFQHPECDFILDWLDPSYTLLPADGVKGPDLPPNAEHHRHAAAEATDQAQMVTTTAIHHHRIPRYKRAAATAAGVPQGPIKTAEPL